MVGREGADRLVDAERLTPTRVLGGVQRTEGRLDVTLTGEDRGGEHVEVEREAVLRGHDRDGVVAVDDEGRVHRRMDEAVRSGADGVGQRERVERERESGAVGLAASS